MCGSHAEVSPVLCSVVSCAVLLPREHTGVGLGVYFCIRHRGILKTISRSVRVSVWKEFMKWIVPA